MPVDRRKGLQAAERLLKQGKLQAALTELQRVSESAPDDLLTLNRLGDLLARQGRNDEAIGYYRKIAIQFAEGGFIPKAAAIHKKILRIDPHNLESLVSLGDLYLGQNLHGEARNYLLHAAGQHLEAKSFEQARKIYEKLVAAEPDELRHRIRLAETRAAEGDAQRAGTEMIELARSLLGQNAPTEAEKVFNRAADLVPDSFEPLLGVCECLVAADREDEALAQLEQRISGDSAPAPIVGELAWHYDRAGRCDEALELIANTRILDVTHQTWLKLFGAYVDREEVDKLWARLDPVLDRCGKEEPARLAELLQRLDEVEERGHLPALERLYELQQQRGETPGIVAALESLVSAYRARSMSKEAARMAERLRELAPEVESAAPRGETPAPSAPVAVATHPRPTASPGRPSEDAPLEAEAPAVPLNRSDEEFVAGRLTQAEVLEKYGLKPQALEQIESVTAKFPGHVKSQEARVELLRAENNPGRLATALAQLALARRAAGDNDSALEAAAEAAAGELGDHARTMLVQCRLIDGRAEPGSEPAAADEPPAVSIVVDSDPETPVGSIAADDGPDDSMEFARIPDTPAGAITLADHPESTIEQTAVGAARSETTSTPRDSTDAVTAQDESADIVIDFDADATATSPAIAEPHSAAPPPTVPGAATRAPGADMLEEIAGCIRDGALDEARKRIQALHTLGYAGEALDALSEQAVSPGTAPLAATPEPATEPAPIATPETTFAGDDDDGLGAIAAALEEELLEDEQEQDAQPLVPEEDPEQSMDEIFSSFKAAVQEQVSDEDHGTHYDLAIAYKEMGLVDEAISEFEVAASAPEFHRQACTMIGLCHLERGEFEPAAAWYRKAIEAALAEGGQEDSLSHLRYELGEVLLQAGDHEQALNEFQQVLQHDPTYREVRARVSELEKQLQP